MSTFERIAGKSLSDASDVVNSQLKYVADTSLSMKEAGEETDLRSYLANLELVDKNVKTLLTQAGNRLDALRKNAMMRLMSSGHMQ